MAKGVGFLNHLSNPNQVRREWASVLHLEFRSKRDLIWHQSNAQLTRLRRAALKEVAFLLAVGVDKEGPCSHTYSVQRIRAAEGRGSKNASQECDLVSTL